MGGTGTRNNQEQGMHGGRIAGKPWFSLSRGAPGGLSIVERFIRVHPSDSVEEITNELPSRVQVRFPKSLDGCKVLDQRFRFRGVFGVDVCYEIENFFHGGW